MLMSRFIQWIAPTKRWIWIAFLLLALLGCTICGTHFYLQQCYPIPTVESFIGKEDLIVFTAHMAPQCTLDTHFAANELYIADPATGKLMHWQIDDEFKPGTVYSWSDERGQLLFVSPDDGVCALSLDGSVDRLPLDLYPDNSASLQGSGLYAYSYAWSPNGERVAFSYRDQIWTQNIDGTGLKQVTHFGTAASNDALDGLATEPSWSPSGEYLVFARKADRCWTIHRIHRNGTGLIALTDSLSGYNWLPKWSPDGKKIAFLHTPVLQQPATIWLMNADGSDFVELLKPYPGDNFSRGVTDYAWSPDSQHIAFLSGKDGPCLILLEEGFWCYQSIYRIDANGENQERLTGRARHQRGMLWIP